MNAKRTFSNTHQKSIMQNVFLPSLQRVGAKRRIGYGLGSTQEQWQNSRRQKGMLLDAAYKTI
jgi:hypothetical protein